jgi:hypothetical protein
MSLRIVSGYELIVAKCRFINLTLKAKRLYGNQYGAFPALPEELNLQPVPSRLRAETNKAFSAMKPVRRGKGINAGLLMGEVSDRIGRRCVCF